MNGTIIVWRACFIHGNNIESNGMIMKCWIQLQKNFRSVDNAMLLLWGD